MVTVTFSAWLGSEADAEAVVAAFGDVQGIGVDGEAGAVVVGGVHGHAAGDAGVVGTTGGDVEGGIVIGGVGIFGHVDGDALGGVVVAGGEAEGVLVAAGSAVGIDGDVGVGWLCDGDGDVFAWLGGKTDAEAVVAAFGDAEGIGVDGEAGAVVVGDTHRHVAGGVGVAAARGAQPDGRGVVRRIIVLGRAHRDGLGGAPVGGREGQRVLVVRRAGVGVHRHIGVARLRQRHRDVTARHRVQADCEGGVGTLGHGQCGCRQVQLHLVVIGDGDGLCDIRGGDAPGRREGDRVGVVGAVDILSCGNGDRLGGVPVGGGEGQRGRREGHIGVSLRKRNSHIRIRCSTEPDREAAPCRIALVDRQRSRRGDIDGGVVFPNLDRDGG